MSAALAFKPVSAPRVKLPNQRPPIRILRTYEEALALNEELLAQPLVALDTEWYNRDKDLDTPVNNGLIACLQFCYRDQAGKLQIIYLHNHGPESENNLFAIRPWLESADSEKILHNAAADAHAVENHGIKPIAFKYDTMVLDWLVDENRTGKDGKPGHSLKECAVDHLGFPESSRKSYNQTFGSPKLKKDGTPYASGQLIVPTMEEMLAQVVAGDSALFAKLVSYSCNDAWDTWCLFEHYRAILRKEPWIGSKSTWDFYILNTTRITTIIQRMERRGMYVDLPFMAEMSERCANDLEGYAATAFQWAGSPFKMAGPQLVHLLYGEGPKEIKKTPTAKKVLYTITGKGYPVLRRTDEHDKTSTPSTNKDHLKELRRHLEKEGYTDEDLFGFDAILVYTSIEKQRNTYLVGLSACARRSRIHGRINQVGTTSGRFSSSDPNLQNVTKGGKDKYNIRDCFVAPPGHTLLVCDFSNLEYRLLAHFSQEPKLLELFRQGWDMHSFMCYSVFDEVKQAAQAKFGTTVTTEMLDWVKEEFGDQRDKAKILNFEIIYGVGAGKLADQLRITRDDAQAMIDGWFKTYPYVKAWKNRVLSDFHAKGVGRTLWGRTRHADMRRLKHQCGPKCPHKQPDRKRCGIQGEEERTLVNSLIQGSAADVALKSMINIDDCQELKDLGVHMIMQVHDELIFECPIQHRDRAIELIRPRMELPFGKPLRLAMPVAIGSSPSWASAKS